MATRFTYLIIVSALTIHVVLSNTNQTGSNNLPTPEANINFDQFAACWSVSNSTCVKAVEDLLENKGDIQISDYIVIEKITNETISEEKSSAGDSDDEGEVGRSGTMDPVLDNIARLLKTRSLKFNLGDVMTLRMARSKEEPGNLEVTLDTVPAEGRGKAQRVGKVIVPLLLGFKITGAVLFAVSAVKIFLIKAFVLSKLALLAALYLLVKKLLSAVGVQHHPYLYSKQVLPQYYHHGMESAVSPEYAYTPYHGQYPSAGDYSQYGGPYQGQYPLSNAGGEAGGAGGVEDLQGHFSHNNIASVQPGASANIRNGTRIAARNDVPGLKPGVFGLVKSSANRVPVSTYRKLVNTGRSLNS